MYILLFVAACFVLQALKDAARGKKRPTVRLTPQTHAECGCVISLGRVIEPCASHKAMIEVLQK